MKSIFAAAMVAPLVALAAIAGCEEPVEIVDIGTIEAVEIERPSSPPLCLNAACGVANCTCTNCDCVEFGQCLETPVVAEPASQKEILDTSHRVKVCGPNGCYWVDAPGPEPKRNMGATTPVYASDRGCSSPRSGPVRRIVKRLFGG